MVGGCCGHYLIEFKLGKPGASFETVARFEGCDLLPEIQKLANCSPAEIVSLGQCGESAIKQNGRIQKYNCSSQKFEYCSRTSSLLHQAARACAAPSSLYLPVNELRVSSERVGVPTPARVEILATQKAVNMARIKLVTGACSRVSSRPSRSSFTTT